MDTTTCQAICRPLLHPHPTQQVCPCPATPSPPAHLDARALQLFVHRQSRALQAPHHGLALAARLRAAHPRACVLDLCTG